MEIEDQRARLQKKSEMYLKTVEFTYRVCSLAQIRKKMFASLGFVVRAAEGALGLLMVPLFEGRPAAELLLAAFFFWNELGMLAKTFKSVVVGKLTAEARFPFRCLLV